MLTRNEICLPFVILSLTIPIHGISTTCSIFRNARDNITPKNCSASVNDICGHFGAVVKNRKSCKCICPRSEGTYMENTQRCTSKENVWPGCKVKLRGPSWSIPVFPLKYSTAKDVFLPSHLKNCRLSIDITQSFYVDVVKGWTIFNPKETFPFKLVTNGNKIQLKWTNAFIKGKTIIRLQINGCKKKFSKNITKDCLLFKVYSHPMSYPCSLPIPTTVAMTTTQPSIVTTTQPSTAHVIETATPGNILQNISTSTTMKTVHPIIVDKEEQGSSSDDGVSWAVIGPIIGVIALLLVCIFVMGLWFLKIWKRKLKNKYKRKNTDTSSFLHNSTPSSSREVDYASPHHPYQDLRPPVHGVPPGSYQSLNKVKAKEDASGYLLPVIPNNEISSMDQNPEPLYNEIGSPGKLPTYDYALPHEALRLTVQSLNENTSNEPAYIGRPSLEGTNCNGANSRAHEGPNVPLEEPGYIELNGEASAQVQQPSVIRYQEPWKNAKGHDQVHEVVPPENGPYRALEPLPESRYESLRHGNDSTV